MAGAILHWCASGAVQREGDTELVDFFNEVHEHDAKRAQKAKELLSKR
jgi:hypothetical protein